MSLARPTSRRVRLSAAAVLAAGVAASAVVPPAFAAQEFDLVFRGTYDPTVRGAEIVTVDPASKRMFIAAGNRIDVVDVADITAPVLVTTIDMTPYGVETTSVSVRNGRLAAASINAVKENPGTVTFFDVDGAFVASVSVGAVPDMITHSPDGTKLAVANEGEIRCDGSTLVDPVGSISIVDLAADPITQSDVATATFSSLDGTEAALRAAGVRIIRPTATASQDLEPESVAFSVDGATIYSSLQDNNALAVVDVATATVTSVTSFGLKDHTAATNRLDLSDRDGAGSNPATNIANWRVFGMFQPDGIGVFASGGTTYVASANEGDSRGDWSACGGNDEVRGGSFSGRGVTPALEAAAGADALTNNDKLNRVQVTNATPMPASGPVDSLYVYGGRSMSIWNGATGALVWDSGDFMETYVEAQLPTLHNAGVGKNPADGYDTRSDNKGPEPEGLAIGQAAGRTLVFVGLERANGIMFWDVTDPSAPVFQEWERSQVIHDADPGTAGNQPAGDLGPEGLTYLPADQSWMGRPLLFVAHEADQGEPGAALPTRTSIYELVAFGNGPDPVIPEVPVTVLLSLSTGALLLGGLTWQRRRSQIVR
jgi:hypothetical protein